MAGKVTAGLAESTGTESLTEVTCRLPAYSTGSALLPMVSRLEVIVEIIRTVLCCIVY